VHFPTALWITGDPVVGRPLTAIGSKPSSSAGTFIQRKSVLLWSSSTPAGAPSSVMTRQEYTSCGRAMRNMSSGNRSAVVSPLVLKACSCTPQWGFAAASGASGSSMTRRARMLESGLPM
jgi:hypothetical protein